MSNETPDRDVAADERAETLRIGPDTTPQQPATGNGDTKVGEHDAATLALPPESDRTLPLGLAPTTDAIHHDATLSPGDPQTQAYQQAALASAPRALTTGASFGHYQLIEPIAKGGMGIVYKARQRNLNRVVAIKMILAGQFADQTDIDRFYAEAEAAAALSHPNIVAIHEIGEVQGQHFFSMDYIEGQSLAGLIQENPLPPRRAAEFVKTIAETMQFAHESGVVHRDLKPANILLDKKQRPLITDFGLAKQVSSQSQRTMAGSIVGTPSYMPPEQAQGKVDEIGPWSDLYSTGAILYELLTGRPPFRAASPFETVRQVIDTEPPSPRLLNPNVPRDLETICLKCLQKNRTARYATEQELADELSRFLRGEPIQARPISQAARFWRLCKRYPVTASAVASATLILIAASVISTFLLIQTTTALAKADRRHQDAMNVVNELFTRISQERLLNEPGMQPLRRDLLDKALAYYEKFLEEGENDPRVRNQLATSYFNVGLLKEALGSPDDALPAYETARRMQAASLEQHSADPKRQKELGDTLNALGRLWTMKKDFDAARKELMEAAHVRAALASGSAATSESNRILANTYMNIGKVELQSANLKAGPEFEAGIEAARKQYEQAQTVRQKALDHDPANFELRRDLGKGFYELGILEYDQNRHGEAEKYFVNATDVFERLTAEQPGDLQNQRLLAVCYRLLGDLLTDNRPKEAEQWYEKALARLGPLADKNPDVPEYQTDRAGVLLNLSDLETATENIAAAIKALTQARDILTPLTQRFPTVPLYRRDLAVTLSQLAMSQMKVGDKGAAAQSKREAVNLLTELVNQFPNDPEYLEPLERARSIGLDGRSQ